MTVTYLNDRGTYTTPLGIGTTIPQYQLHVNNSTYADSVYLEGILNTDTLFTASTSNPTYPLYVGIGTLPVTDLSVGLVSYTSNLVTPSIEDGIPLTCTNITSPEFYMYELINTSALAGGAGAVSTTVKAVSITSGMNLISFRVGAYNSVLTTNTYTLQYSTNGGTTYTNVATFPLVITVVNSHTYCHYIHPINWLNSFTTTHWRVVQNVGIWNTSDSLMVNIFRLPPPALDPSFTMPPQA